MFSAEGLLDAIAGEDFPAVLSLLASEPVIQWTEIMQSGRYDHIRKLVCLRGIQNIGRETYDIILSARPEGSLGYAGFVRWIASAGSHEVHMLNLLHLAQNGQDALARELVCSKSLPTARIVSRFCNTNYDIITRAVCEALVSTRVVDCTTLLTALCHTLDTHITVDTVEALVWLANGPGVDIDNCFDMYIERNTIRLLNASGVFLRYGCAVYDIDCPFIDFNAEGLCSYHRPLADAVLRGRMCRNTARLVLDYVCAR